MIHEYKNTCTGSSKHILAPCTLHALDSSIGSDGSSQRTPCQPSKHAQLARSPCRVHVPSSQTGWQVGLLTSGDLPSDSLRGSRTGRGSSSWPEREAPRTARRSSQPWPWHQSPADEIEGVRVSLWHSAAGAIPAVEALALARRHARAVARAPALALRLGAVVTAPSVRARALARRHAVATSSRLRRSSTLRTRFRNMPKPSNQRGPSPFDKTRGGTTQ